MNIRYFWVADRLKAHHIKIEHCPTSKLFGDFFTKLLQGSLFRKMRDVVQGIESIDILDGVPVSKSKEALDERMDDEETIDSDSTLSLLHMERVGILKKDEDERIEKRGVSFCEGNRIDNQQISDDRKTYADIVRG